MSRWASPTPAQMREAFNDLKVSWTAHKKVSTGRGPWREGLRAATVHHTAGKNFADYLATIYSLPGANCVINNGQYNGKSVDGRAVILSWGDAWHSGAGGPWSGIASRDSLHRVSWGIEIESMGTRRDITDAQKENVGRMLAALVELGMPLKNIHRHADWTDGTGPVPGPLPTRGRRSTPTRLSGTPRSCGWTLRRSTAAMPGRQGAQSRGMRARRRGESHQSSLMADCVPAAGPRLLQGPCQSEGRRATRAGHPEPPG